MKRATLAEVRRKEAHALYTSERRIYTDILDSDARQRAEIRALRRALTTIANLNNWGHDGGWDAPSYPDEREAS